MQKDDAAYFSSFVEGLDPAEVDAHSPRPVDPGADSLPFNLLDDRRFEVLAYRLKCAEFGQRARTSLMLGVKDRGRLLIGGEEYES